MPSAAIVTQEDEKVEPVKGKVNILVHSADETKYQMLQKRYMALLEKYVELSLTAWDLEKQCRKLVKRVREIRNA